MGVYIKNMKKPEHCGCCRFASAFDCRITGEFIEDHNQILNSCPLVELPTPHGRLIDGDKLYDEFAELETEASEHVRKIGGVEDLTEEWKQWSVILTERTASKHVILDAITVLESEK